MDLLPDSVLQIAIGPDVEEEKCFFFFSFDSDVAKRIIVEQGMPTWSKPSG